MVDVDMIQEQIQLGQLYKSRWGKEVDFVGMPSVLSQYKFLSVMRLMVDTGDSVLIICISYRFAKSPTFVL